MKSSPGELMFMQQLAAVKISGYEREYRFHPERMWRLDFAFPDIKLAVEIEGGVYSNGRHSRGAGFTDDCIKYGQAMLLGWDIYRCTTEMVKNGMALTMLEKLMELKR